MTDLKEMIEREISGFLDWPGDNKHIVTTTSAKLFAEHVAQLYAESKPAPDVTQLVEALETLLAVRVVEADVSYGLAYAKAEQALAAHRKGA